MGDGCERAQHHQAEGDQHDRPEVPPSQPGHVASSRPELAPAEPRWSKGDHTALRPVAFQCEIRERFAKDAAISETETMESGKAVPLATAFDYLEARAQGKRVRRPQARKWRASR